MKSFPVFATLLGVVSAAAVSSKYGADKRAIAWAPLVWTGQVKIGEDDITLNGTAKEIHDQILAINPDYDTQLGVKSDAVVRRHSPWPDNPINVDSINCNVFERTSSDWAEDGITQLYAIGNGGCSAPAGWGGCIRTACNGGGAGIFLCNDHPDPITVPCKFVADNALGINTTGDKGCVVSKYEPSPVDSGSLGIWWHYVQGQIFSFDRTWNVIVTSSACGDPATNGP